MTNPMQWLPEGTAYRRATSRELEVLPREAAFRPTTKDGRGGYLTRSTGETFRVRLLLRW